MIFVFYNDVYACARLKQGPSILRGRRYAGAHKRNDALKLGEGKQGITRLRHPFLQRQRYVYCKTIAAGPARRHYVECSAFRAPSHGLAAPTTEAVIGSARAFVYVPSCSGVGSLAHHDFRNRLSVGNSGVTVGRECRIGDSAAQEVNGFLEGAIILLVGRYVRLRAQLFVAFRLQVAA